jgi:hypothetical protein
MISYKVMKVILLILDLLYKLIHEIYNFKFYLDRVLVLIEKIVD